MKLVEAASVAGTGFEWFWVPDAWSCAVCSTSYFQAYAWEKSLLHEEKATRCNKWSTVQFTFCTTIRIMLNNLQGGCIQMHSIAAETLANPYFLNFVLTVFYRFSRVGKFSWTKRIPYHAKLECASKYREATNPKFWTVLQSRLWEGKILQLLRIYSRWCFGECTLSCRSLGECYHIPDWALTSQEHHQPIQSIGNASCSKIPDTP